MKKQIHRAVKNRAYFVREPEVALTDISRSQLDVEHIFNESPDVAKRRLKYKIDRGEYDFSAAVYAKKVLYCFETGESLVPQKLVNKWIVDVVFPLFEKTKEQFTVKFSLEALTQNLSDYEKESFLKEIDDYLLNDLEKRSTNEPLPELPKFVSNAIDEYEAESKNIDP
tara:strand:- start:205 stop:711 length:507 start_codon:yes stop_codon:yes gene_type:complete